MNLFSTKYPNQERSVSGTYTVDNEDSILLCNTSTAAVTINLASIVANNWNTVYKLYIIDNNSLAGTNNITITAPAGFTINNTTSVIINVNGGSCIVSINSNTKYTCTLNYSATANTDTGWLDLQGFSWITTAALVPQYRVINNQIIFRRNIVIPLVDGGGSVVNYATDGTYGTTYVNTAFVAPYTGVSNGVTLFTGGCYFNNSSPVIASSANYPDANYESVWIVGSKYQIFTAGDSAGYYTSTYILTLTTGGLLRLDTINSKELVVFPLQTLGNALLRQINSKTIANSYAGNFNDIVDSMTIARTLNGSLITNYDFPQVNSIGKLHTATFDPALQTQFGGMTIPLNGFLAYKT